MERHGKEAGLTQGSHGGPQHLLTPSGIAAELKYDHAAETASPPLPFLILLLFLTLSKRNAHGRASQNIYVQLTIHIVESSQGLGP